MKAYWRVFLLLLGLYTFSPVVAQEKYAISHDFASACRLTPPLNRGVLDIGNFFLGIMPKGMNSNKQLTIEKHKIISSTDGKQIGIWVITPTTIDTIDTTQSRACHLFVHGGGFVFKGAPYHYTLAQEYALRTRSIVAFVDYRMAYNNKYGTTLTDCCDAWQWLVSNADVLGIDHKRMSIIGDSAGGFLAIKTTLHCIEQGATIPSSLMLIYPVVDCTMRTASMKEYTDTPVWNSTLNAQMWQYYLQDNEEQSILDLPQSLLMQFPPTYIETAQYDCLRDEGYTFAQLLHNANVPTTYIATDSTMHGFDMVQESNITKGQITRRCDWLTKRE